MDISIADFIIHVDETLPQEQLEKLEEIVRQGSCVISAHVPEGKPHLMLVAYNPECTSAKEILDTVTGQGGVHAEAAGL
jgi:hypothetical protein